MKKLILTLLVTISLTALAGYNEDKVFNVDGNAKLSLSNVSGDIVIKRGGVGQVEIQAKVTDDDIRVEFHQSGDRIEVRTEYPKRSNSHGSASFTVYVPDQSELDINSVSGSIDIEDLEGDASVHTVSGSIKARELSGNLEFQTVSGRIIMDKIGPASLDANSVSGSLTYSGDFTPLGKHGSYKFNTTSGSVKLSHSSQAGYAIIGSTVSGSITNDVGGELCVNKSKYGPNSTLDGVYGGNGSSVKVSTVSGSISITRK